MMMMNGGGLIPILLIFFLGWVLIADTPYSRIDRSCAPINWIGTVAEAGTDLVSSDSSKKVKVFFDSGKASCEYMVFRIFVFEEKETKEVIKIIEDTEPVVLE